MATFIYMNQICFIDYIAHRLYYNGKFIYINQICLNTSKKKPTHLMQTTYIRYF